MALRSIILIFKYLFHSVMGRLNKVIRRKTLRLRNYTAKRFSALQAWKGTE